MADSTPRKADRKRWRSEIVRHLEDFPRQYAALESAMGAFGEDFDLKAFKEAFNTTSDMEAYNRVQAVERALGRVQNYVAELAIAAAKLAEVRPSKEMHASEAVCAFTALRDAKAIDATLCRRLVRAQTARATIEHGYIQTSAGDVHEAARLVLNTARDFIGRYRTWIELYLASESDTNASD